LKKFQITNTIFRSCDKASIAPPATDQDTSKVPDRSSINQAADLPAVPATGTAQTTNATAASSITVTNLHAAECDLFRRSGFCPPTGALAAGQPHLLYSVVAVIRVLLLKGVILFFYCCSQYFFLLMIPFSISFKYSSSSFLLKVLKQLQYE
jgi:hypothetical protein